MIKSASSDSQWPHLHRINRIKSVQGTLEIEGNPEHRPGYGGAGRKKVMANPRELLEVQNAFAVYEDLDRWKTDSHEDLLSAHQMMMAGLVDEPGRSVPATSGCMTLTGCSMWRPDRTACPN